MKGELVGIFIFKIKSSKCNQNLSESFVCKIKVSKEFCQSQYGNERKTYCLNLVLYCIPGGVHVVHNSKTAKSSRKHTNNPAGQQHWKVIRFNTKGMFSDIKRPDCRFENNFRADLIHNSGRHSLPSPGFPRRHFAGSAGPLDTYPTFTPNPTNRLLRITS